MLKLDLPRIVSVREKTLLDYNGAGYFRSIKSLDSLAADAKMMLSDHEITLLLLWAMVSPSAGLAYLIWKKYQKFRWLALPLLALSVVQFVGQWGGVLWLTKRFWGAG